MEKAPKPLIKTPQLKYLVKESVEIAAPKQSMLSENASISPGRKYFKKSTLFTLSPILHRWMKNEVILSLFNNTLLFRKKAKETMIELSNFNVKNIGKFKKKWCFELESLKPEPKKKKLKKYVIGCESKELLDEWIGLLTVEIKKKASREDFQSSPENHLNKQSSSNTEHMDDLGPMSSSHNIGLLLSKYENFMVKGEILSPSKLIDQKKRILQILNLELIDVFGDFSEFVEKKDFIMDSNWDLRHIDQFTNKSFRIFTHHKDPRKGRVIMELDHKRPDEIFSLFLDQPVWDKALSKRVVRPCKKAKEFLISDVFKPFEGCDPRSIQLDYLRFSNRLKGHTFFLGKTVIEEKENEKEKEIQDGISKGFISKLMVSVSTLSSLGKTVSVVFIDLEAVFDNFSNKPVNPEQNSKLLMKFLENYKSFHYFVVPHGALIKSPVSIEELAIIPKASESLSSDLEKDSIKSEKINAWKKDAPVFSKGNAEFYADLANLENLYKYYHNGYHVLDCILSYHEMGLLEDCDQKIETNLLQGHFAYKKDYQRGKKGGLNYLNSELMSEQKKVILNLLKQAGSNLIHGRGFINVSLPVGVFEPRSFLERLARSFGHAPLFLGKATMTSNVVEQMKLTIAFFLSSMVLCIQQEKPFNPILGETFQGRINGCPIYLEQLKHHPPLTYYYMIGKNYRLYGSHEPVANLSANTCVAQQKGSPIAFFMNNNCKICFRWPLFIINGTAMGQRSFNFFSKAIAYEKEHGYLCEVLFNVNEVGGFKGLFQKKDYFIDEIGGGIYKVKPEVITRYENAKKPFKLELNRETDVIETVCKLKGEWTSYVEFDGVRYWDIESDRPFLLEYEPNCLPSDSNFRDDVLFLRMGKKEEAQLKKNEGENSQRYEKKLRDNYKKKADLKKN